MRGTDPIKSTWEYPNLIFVKVKLHIAIKYVDYIFFIFSFLLVKKLPKMVIFFYN
jgi:hypothetical protein